MTLLEDRLCEAFSNYLLCQLMIIYQTKGKHKTKNQTKPIKLTMVIDI